MSKERGVALILIAVVSSGVNPLKVIIPVSGSTVPQSSIVVTATWLTILYAKICLLVESAIILSAK